MMAEWKEYTGSDEQIAEMVNAQHGYTLLFNDAYQSEIYMLNHPGRYVNEPAIMKYLICNPHPRRDMIKRQADTGQPVWVKICVNAVSRDYKVFSTTRPNWDIPNAEYSFTPFEVIE